MFKVGPQEENNAVLEDTALWNRKRRHDTAQGPIIPDSRRLRVQRDKVARCFCNFTFTQNLSRQGYLLSVC